MNHTLHGTNISHLGKRKIIDSKVPVGGIFPGEYLVDANFTPCLHGLGCCGLNSGTLGPQLYKWLGGFRETFYHKGKGPQKWSYHHKCLNSHYFHIIGDGHQPNSRGLYTHYKDSLLKVG